MRDTPDEKLDCPVCFLPLPLRLPSDVDTAQKWRCVGCGMQLEAVLVEDCSEEIRDTVRLVREVKFDECELSPPPTAVVEFASTLAESSDRRIAERRALVKTVPVVPVDADFSPIGEPFMAVSRNVSVGGIAILHVVPIAQELLAVRLTKRENETMELVVKVTRTRTVGEFYEISGRFIAKLAV